MTKQRRSRKPKPEAPAADAVAALEKLLSVFIGLSAHFQPGTSVKPNPHADDKCFRYWSERAAETARYLAPYQAPQQRTVTVPAPRERAGVLSFSLRIFDNSKRLVRETRDGVTVFEDEPVAPKPASEAVVIEAEAVEVEPVEPVAPVPAPANVVPLVRVPEGPEAA